MPAMAGLFSLWVMAIAICVAHGGDGRLASEVQPIVWYRFENLTDHGIDTQGYCDLKISSTKFPSPEGAAHDSDSIGNYLVFNLDNKIRNDSRPFAWNAKACSNVTSGADGVTIEFLIKPTANCFLRGKSLVHGYPLFIPSRWQCNPVPIPSFRV